MTELVTELIDDVAQAAAILKRGGIVAFATETVFGLGADATNDDALQRLFAAKGRPSDNPLIAHIAHVSNWPCVASSMPRVAEQLLERFSPGPLTVVLPKHPAISRAVTAGLETVGLRIPKHEQARQLLALAGVPVAAPSANRSGLPSGTTWQTVLEDLDGRVDAILRGSTCDIGIESTVVDCTSDKPRLLRPGAISFLELQAVAPELIDYSPSITADATVNSPGLRHPHYRPRATVHLVASALEADQQMKGGRKTVSELEQHLANCAYCGLEESKLATYLGAHRCFASLSEYAQNFFEFMRFVDRLEVEQLYCQLPSASGLGAALRDRLTRAAQK